MRKLYLLLCIVFVLGLSSVSIGIQTIGDFSTLDNWKGLIGSNQLTPCGDAVAILTAPGEASFEYTQPKEYLGWEAPHFASMYDEIAVGDWYEHKYIEFQAYLPDDRAFEFEFTISPMMMGRPDFMKSLSSKVIIRSQGWQKVVLSLKDFDYKHHQGTFWRFIKSISITGKFAEGDVDHLIQNSQNASKSQIIGGENKSFFGGINDTVLKDFQQNMHLI